MSWLTRLVERLVKKRQPTPLPPAPAPAPAPVPAPAPAPWPATSPFGLVQIPGTYHPRLYPYWANAVVFLDRTNVFGGDVNRGPVFYHIDGDRQVHPLGNPTGLSGTTEGWYWDREARLYVPYGAVLRRYHPLSGGEAEDVFNVMAAFPGCRLWQCHSSDDGLTHSGTVQRDGEPWDFVATVVWKEGRLRVYPPGGTLDESQVTPDGNWLVIKETANDTGKLYNRVVDLRTDQEYRLEPPIGHSDCGPSMLVGENSTVGKAELVDLASRERTGLISTWNMGHVSVRWPYALFSRHEEGLLLHYDLQLDSQRTVMNHGVVTNDYDQQVRANLSPCGTRAAFTMRGGLYVLGLLGQ